MGTKTDTYLSLYVASQQSKHNCSGMFSSWVQFLGCLLLYFVHAVDILYKDFLKTVYFMYTYCIHACPQTAQIHTVHRLYKYFTFLRCGYCISSYIYNVHRQHRLYKCCTYTVYSCRHTLHTLQLYAETVHRLYTYYTHTVNRLYTDCTHTIHIWTDIKSQGLWNMLYTSRIISKYVHIPKI
jgi:hypothetical protein